MSRRPNLLASARSAKGASLIILSLLTALALAFTIAAAPAPQISRQYGQTTIEISADRAWTLYPGDCLQIAWQLEGIQSLYIEGAGQIGQGEMSFCPALNKTSPKIEITAANGIYRAPQLTIHHLPNLFFYLFGFVGLGVLGLLVLHYLRRGQLDRMPPLYWLLIAALLLATIGAFLWLMPQKPPSIDAEDGSIALRFWAERDSIIFPHECLDVGWSVSGARSIRFQGEPAPLDQNPGSGLFCAGAGNSALLEVVDSGGGRYQYSLAFSSLFPAPAVPPPPMTWSLFLLLLALIIFGLLLWRGLARNWRSISSADKVALAACFLFPIAFYLPFGFETPPHWENWILHSYAEGGIPGFFDSWVVTRFSGLAHRVLAYLISSESFVGYNLVNCLMHSAMAALFYGLCRQVKIAPLYAFLMALLFIVYPVNPLQFSSRALLINYSKLFLLAAMFLALACQRAPTRLALAGIWLALAFSVNSYEAGLALVLVLPLFWWLTDRKFNWRNLNLTAIWYLAPAFKLAYLALLTATGREFYQSGLLNAGSNSSTSDLLGTFLNMIRWVYPFTFWESWQEAALTLQHNAWWPLTIFMLAAVAAVAWHLARQQTAPAPPNRQLALAITLGALLIIPSIAVLMWIPLYQYDPWRMLTYAPIGAVIAIFSALLLLAKTLPARAIRPAAITAACLLLLLPGSSRLFLQLDSLVESANKKAHILRELVTLAPEPYPQTQIALITEQDSEFLHEQGIFELLTRDMFHSALHTLYQSNAPELAYFCLRINDCSYLQDGHTLFTSDKPEDLLPRTLVFKLNADLSVEIIADPAAFLGLDIDVPYDASQLYNAAAPRPPRLTTMLPR